MYVSGVYGACAVCTRGVYGWVYTGMGTGRVYMRCYYRFYAFNRGLRPCFTTAELHAGTARLHAGTARLHAGIARLRNVHTARKVIKVTERRV